MCRFILLSLIGFMCLNCNLTSAQSNPIGIEEYNDHLLFRYSSDIELKRDKEVFKPISFKIELPKGVRYWEISNSCDFGFYYKSSQVIFVSTDIYNERTKSDTSYVPSKKEIEKLISSSFVTNNHKKWNIKEMHLINNRKHLVIKKDGTIILLFNIKEAKLQYYSSLAKRYVQ